LNDMGHFPIPEERMVALLSDSKMNSLEREKCDGVLVKWVDWWYKYTDMRTDGRSMQYTVYIIFDKEAGSRTKGSREQVHAGCETLQNMTLKVYSYFIKIFPGHGK